MTRNTTSDGEANVFGKKKRKSKAFSQCDQNQGVPGKKSLKSDYIDLSYSRLKGSTPCRNKKQYLTYLYLTEKLSFTHILRACGSEKIRTVMAII